MIEYEKTYLAKHLPAGLETCPKKEVVDLYFPIDSEHPKLRLRKSGEKLEMTKKEKINHDASTQMEQTIILSEAEYLALAEIPGKGIAKTRYFYQHQGNLAEIDVFQEELKGLVLIDFEFASEEQKNSFVMPDFCLADVTSEEFIAGGMLCGKTFGDIEEGLEKYKYNKISS
jgi:CYTH domain-containing protein